MPSFPVVHVDRGASLYPARLERRLGRPPVRLHHRGALPGPAPTVAIVGARAASGDGCERTAAIAACCADAGYAVVSGGALGIDAAAHQGALCAGGLTFAVLGCGADIIYPERHAALFDRILLAGGGLVSEYPPGTPPRAGNFPARNRLIAALADVVVVVEAGSRSGALITAAAGRRMGLPLLAVAGTAGADRMIRAGIARPLRAGRDVIEQIEDARAGGPVGATGDLFAPDPAGPFVALVGALGERARSAAEVASQLALPLQQVMGLLSAAELAGEVRRLPGGRYEVSRVH